VLRRDKKYRPAEAGRYRAHAQRGPCPEASGVCRPFEWKGKTLARSVPFGLLVVFSLVVSSVVFSPGQQEAMGFAVLVFVHGPERMGAVLEAAGLVRATRRETLVWTLDLYRRGDLI